MTGAGPKPRGVVLKDELRGTGVGADKKEREVPREEEGFSGDAIEGGAMGGARGGAKTIDIKEEEVPEGWEESGDRKGLDKGRKGLWDEEASGSGLAMWPPPSCVPWGPFWVDEETKGT